MYRLFSRNTPMAYAALLLLLVGLRGRLVFDPARYAVADTPDLYTPLWSQLLGHVAPGGALSVVMAIVVTLLCALIVNNIANRFGFVGSYGVLGGMFFVVLSGGFRLGLGFQPVFVFALSLVWGLDRLFSAMGKKRPYASVAWGFAIVGLGCLFWSKGVCFLPFMLVLLALLRLGGGRCLAAALCGVLGAVMVGVCHAMLCPDPAEAALAFVRSGLATLPYWRMGAVSITYLTVCLGTTLLAILSAQRHIAENSIAVSRRVRVAEWVFFFSILLCLLPGFSLDIQILVAVGVSLLLPGFVGSIRGARLREAVPVALTAATAWIIYA